MNNRRSSCSAAFTLIELLVVIGIVALIAGVAVSINREEGKDIYVKSAADELAAVLRETRERAIRSRLVYAVVFNLENAPGSSGAILNNRSGGHWYRVIGPKSGMQGWNNQVGFPPFFDRAYSGLGGIGGGVDSTWVLPAAYADNPIRRHLEAVEQAWVGAPHVLPKKKVRFLALTDQDNGSVRKDGDTYPATYPRPWFGTWDTVTKRIHAWGGYDPSLALANQTGLTATKQRARVIGGRTISHTGFFYEGYDGPISGCVHPTDRLVLDDTNGDGRIIIDAAYPQVSDDPTKRFPLWHANDPRPLINGAWQDYMIVFNPDGSVWTSWMRMRHEYAKFYQRKLNLCYDPALDTTNGDAVVTAGHYHLKELGPFDLCNRISASEGYPQTLYDHPEASNWMNRSGYAYITLAPDAQTDRDTYIDAEHYLRELSPCYRVGISPYGDVRVVRVRTTALPAGKVLDTTITGTGWNTKATTDTYYPKGELTNPDGSPRGEPAVDAVTADMLRQRTWWWQ